MQSPDNKPFANEATRRFHDYFYPLTKESKEKQKQFFDAFKLKGGNPYSLLAQMRNEERSITIEHVYIARDKFGINPGYLFGINDQQFIGFADNLVEEPNAEYALKDGEVQRHVSEKVNHILHKHKIKIEPFAKSRLQISKQAMYDKLKGKTRMFFDEVLVICEDTGESLDQFRRTPLPKGHHLQQMEMMQQMIELLKAENVQLKKHLKVKK